MFDVIEWRRFEAVVETLFQQTGFETQSQSHGADDGVDVWLYSRSQPGAPVSLVQCQHWQGKRVGVALAGDCWRPTCVNCGVKLMNRAARQGGSAFWGCAHDPRCKTTMAMRTA